MGIFSKIIDGYKKSEASAILQHYFSRQAGVVWVGKETPKSLANMLIDAAWDIHPAFFNGSYGARPHKYVLAACSLSSAIDAYGLDSQEADYLSEAFIEIMTNLTKHKRSNDFNAVDNTLLKGCLPIYNRIINEANSFIENLENSLAHKVPTVG
jgi:hypothetical protein